MDIKKNYKSFPIPNREQLVENNVYNTKYHNDLTTDVFDYNPFAEIDINQSYIDCDEIPALQVQAVDSVLDEKRALFYSMRQIALNEPLYYDTNNSKIFYNQALFMENFEDDYEIQVPFSSYYPCYQKMGYAQLRAYFTWRTNVRAKNVTHTCTSYAFLYIYELLNNIGVTDPEDGLEKLTYFWKSYRAYDTVIDRYMLQWVKDYHVYYPLKRSFRKFAADNNIEMHYPTVFGYDSDQHNSFEIFARISKYNIKKSIFYSEENCQMINDCFYFILNRFRKVFEENKKCFEDLIFYTIDKSSVWMPFSRSLFYPALKQENRQVVISEREIYSSLYNQWMYKRVILSERGKHFIGYIMKEMEASLRKALGFKYVITADVNKCDTAIRKMLKAMGISLPKIIRESVSEFHALSKRKIVTVDIENVNQIRQAALNTQEKLIVSEEDNIENTTKAEEKTDTIKEKNPIISDIWGDFLKSLTSIELEALKLVLTEENIKEFAIKNKIMLEVLADGINQKATDCIGDALLEVEDTVSIYEDYKTKLSERIDTYGKYST